MSGDPTATASADPLDRALFGCRGSTAARAVALGGILFVVAAFAFGMLDRLRQLAVFRGVARSTVVYGGTVGLVALAAAHAYLNEGLVVCWLLVFGPVFGTTAALGGSVFATGEVGLLAALTASAIGAATVAVALGGVGFLVGYLVRQVRF